MVSPMMLAATEISDNLTPRTLSDISEVETTIRIGVDLVSATRRNIGFLRTVNESQWLHERATVVEAIRRYDELWMPLICDLTVGSTPARILPPFDIEWQPNTILHSFNDIEVTNIISQVSYRQYCESRFSKLIGKPAIFDEENEEYALMRCKEIWINRYPAEPFENEVDSDSSDNPVVIVNEDILTEVKRQRFLYSKFSEPYMCEIVYLIAARQRYKGFLFMLDKFTDECSCFVPAFDIQLMWITHLSYPTVYAEDLKDMWDEMGKKVVGVWDTVKPKEVEETKKLWERNFDQPYEKAGGGLALELDGTASVKPPVYWDVSDTDVNSKYKSLVPRFLLEASPLQFLRLKQSLVGANLFVRELILVSTLQVCVFLRLKPQIKATQENIRHDFMRLRMVRCYRELKVDKSLSSFSNNSWRKAWHLYCEFGSRGLILKLRHRGGYCLRGSALKGAITFHWNDLLRAPSLTVQREIEQVQVSVSITPAVQAPYLLKCVPDRVTDDSGAMISDVILRLNGYRPQEGRWLSRTVLDHAGRECFVVRMRVGGGFWRRGGEKPSAVRWEDRVIEIREGSWSYVAGSIGKAPEKVVGTATPKEPTAQCQAAWHFSTGDELMISWESSSSSSSTTSGLKFTLINQTSPDSSLILLRGRKMQYQGKTGLQSKDQEDDDEGFVTLIRFSEENPTGRVTALLNWKLLEDLGSLLIRRRLKEAKLGARDWGSVILHPSSFSSAGSSPYIQPWYWNANQVMARGVDNITRQPDFRYSLVEGGDNLYKKGIIS
ncbi:hypothetical protein Patl1_22336 [Pistacia atlantica]|uniref:Uncharacterized protein n=1 Tax=Pistacia atlantica TaxID=434234 RepID=A0ACC1A0S3_9ROSI|nr:hypothetical protein Patl1_22336 [Pistacia atlantica]